MEAKMHHMYVILLIVVLLGSFVLHYFRTSTVNLPVKNLNEHLQDLVSYYSNDLHLCTASAPEIILGRPTTSSVAFKVWSGASGSFFLQYGTTENLGMETAKANMVPENTVTGSLENLKKFTTYFYQLVYQYGESSCASDVHSFVTGRAGSDSFSFAIMSDIHFMDAGYDAQILETCLGSIGKTKPDFLIDLGHQFIGMKLGYSANSLHIPYETLFHKYSDICHSIPLYLLNGFKEGENGWEITTPPEKSMAVITAETRKNYYANPEPNFFYTGNTMQAYGIGFQGDYYAWLWGGALFVGIDPNWYTNTFPQEGQSCGFGWCWTLGFEQYKFLSNTLTNSKADFKFVFSHQLLGGAFGPAVAASCGKGPDASYDGFGGAKWTEYFEWGGLDEDGKYNFPAHRPGWDVPLHSLFVKTGVNVVFKGHDMFYSKFTRDGLLYLTVPHPFTNALSNHEEYADKLICHGYDPSDSTIDLAGGFFSVQVSQTTATVIYTTTYGEVKETTTIRK